MILPVHREVQHDIRTGPSLELNQRLIRQVLQLRQKARKTAVKRKENALRREIREEQLRRLQLLRAEFAGPP